MKAILVAAVLLLTTLAFVPSGAAAPPEPQCLPVYQRTDVGTISIVRPNTCTVQVYECPYEGAPTSQCRNLIG